MKASRFIRSASVLASAALILGAFVAPADAKKKKRPKPVPPPPPACAPFTPAEVGAEAPTTVVTETATADAPVEVKLTVGAGVGTAVGQPDADAVLTSQIKHAVQNVQVDTPADSTLFIRLEMPEDTDHDLYVHDAAGEVVAQAAGFNPEPAIYNDNTHGGHTEVGAEVIDGLATADCGGYTIDVAGATTPGGDVTLKLWVE